MDSFRILFDKAEAAGTAAALGATPVPMVVTQRANPLDDASPVERAWFVGDGVCGFAWVSITAKAGDTATRRFINWLKANGIGHKGYPKGWSYSGRWGLSGTAVQSLTRNEAGARAFAEVLREAGITAYAESRID